MLIHYMENDVVHRIRSKTKAKPVYGALCGNGLAPTYINNSHFTNLKRHTTCLICLEKLGRINNA